MRFSSDGANTASGQAKTPLLCLALVVTAILAAIIAMLYPIEKAMASDQASTVASVDPVSQKDSYQAVLYDNTNGLPTSEANAIAQAEDGFIWIGSYAGLVRYDGKRFELIGFNEGIRSVTCLLVDSKGRLWIGTNDSGLFLMEQDSFSNWDEKDGLPSAAVRSLTEDAHGTIYVATTDGLAMMDEQLQVCPLHDSRLDEAYIQVVRSGPDVRIYGVTNDANLFVVKGDKVEYFLNRDDIPGNGANSVFPDQCKPGYVYVSTSDATLYYGRLADGVDALEPLDVSPLSQIDRFEYIDDKVWLCARNGIGVLDENEFHLLENLPMQSIVGHVIEDYAGNLWFTSSRQGVMKIVPSRFVDYSADYGLEKEVVNSTCLLDDKLYIGTDTGLKVLDEGSLVPSIPLTQAQTASGRDLGVTDLMELLDGCRIRSIIRDSEDRLWIATWRSIGLVRYDNGQVTVFSTEDGLFSKNVRAVHEKQDGSILVAATGGVNVIEGDLVTSGYDEDSGIGNTEILTVTEGFDGEVVCGTDGGGIYIVSEAGARHIGREEGLSSESVMRIKRDPTRDLLWFVTGNSIGYLDANYQAHLIDGFPYSNNFDLYENNMGEMWVLGSNGINIALTEDLLKGGEIDVVHYGLSNGLPTITTVNSYSELSDDGNLYIAGSTGVAEVNIDEPFRDAEVIKAAIPYVEADGVRMYPDEKGTFTIPSSVRKLTIYGFVFNYSLTDPQISYRLEGFDQEDMTVSFSDLYPVDYTNLRGGEYCFTMELSDSILLESSAVSAKIIKEKAIYEHLWFYAVLALVVGLILWAVIRSYIRYRMRILEEKNREEAKKERIESELAMAREIQRGVLPGDFATVLGGRDIDIYATMESAKETGGDFYDLFPIDDKHICMVIADVSGKGIPAALFMMSSKSILKNCAMLTTSPAEVMKKANDAICSDNEMDMFVTVWLGILDVPSGKLVASNAGHEYPILKKADGGFELMKDKHGMMIGVMEGFPYSEYELQLQPGDAIFLYTDGVAEATDSQRQRFGCDRIVDALNQDPSASPKRLLEIVRSAVDDFVKDAEQFDDLTMMCMEYGKRQ